MQQFIYDVNLIFLNNNQMKNQIIPNVFKLMLGTSALLVSVAFFIRTIAPVQSNNPDNIVSSALDVKVSLLFLKEPLWVVVLAYTYPKRALR
jgi:hypothetical protein